MTFIQFPAVLLRIKATVIEPRIRQLVDHAGMTHQVSVGPARQTQQPQQPPEHHRAFGQQSQIAIAAQQWFQPIQKTQQRLIPHISPCCKGALEQTGQALPGVVAQHRQPG